MCVCVWGGVNRVYFNKIQYYHFVHANLQFLFNTGDQHEEAIVGFLGECVQNILQELVTMAIIRHNTVSLVDPFRIQIKSR